MIKLLTLFKTQRNVARDEFRCFWRDEFFPAFHGLPVARANLIRAVHNHVIPTAIRDDGEQEINNKWAGAGCYYFSSRVMAESLLADPGYRQLLAESRSMLPEVIHLLVDEVWIYNRDRSKLPVKGFAFFKRQPQLSRIEALQYYQGPHADVGAEINNGRTVRYIQNHVLLDYDDPDPRYRYDGGPEIWFRSMETAMDLYGDKQAMAALAADEANFVLHEGLIHFLTDEETVYEENR